ncbi:hypothetical protein L6164_026818 [Bauhinia variegata]|uniref:Uncharacterized protein n=1 Tax=Bauhinia variegata TaxID=167791 RepID=A0ACB9LRD4_BAUVA|nr:hypothetical protein L6164_026818 [Bauhinia variegata]
MRSFLLLLSTFLAFLSFSELSQARDIQPWLLSCTSSCGDIQNISYPFRLSGQPLSCGDPDYTLSCDNKKLILEFDAGKYYVKSINYDTKRIRVVDANLANETCSLPTQPIHDYNVMGDLRYKGIVYNEGIGFVNCSRPINDTSSFRIPCMSTQNGSIFYAAYKSEIVYGTEQFCSYPPLSAALVARDDYNAKSPSSFGDIERLLQGGFDLSCSIECRDCIRSGRECWVYDDTKPYHVCRKPFNERDYVIKVYLVLGAIVISGSSNSYSLSRIYERLSKGEELDLGNVAETEAIIARKLCMIGLWCIQVNISERPSMSKVVEMLEHGTEE